MKILKSFVIGVFLLTTISPALAGKIENITACASKAKEFANISLDESDATYEGNFISNSIVGWDEGFFKRIKVVCEAKLGGVYNLTINEKQYIYEGFAGVEAYDLNKQYEEIIVKASKYFDSKHAVIKQKINTITLTFNSRNEDNKEFDELKDSVQDFHASRKEYERTVKDFFKSSMVLLKQKVKNITQTLKTNFLDEELKKLLINLNNTINEKAERTNQLVDIANLKVEQASQLEKQIRQQLIKNFNTTRTEILADLSNALENEKYSLVIDESEKYLNLVSNDEELLNLQTLAKSGLREREIERETARARKKSKEDSKSGALGLEIMTADFGSLSSCLEGIKRSSGLSLNVKTDKPNVVSGFLKKGQFFACQKKETGTRGTYYHGWYRVNTP